MYVCVCMYMCMYVCVYVCICMYVCVCMYRGGSRICGKGGAQRRSRLKTLFGISKGGRRGRAPSLALLEDPLWNFKRGGRAPPAPPPPESASDVCSPMCVCMYVGLCMYVCMYVCVCILIYGCMDGW